MLRKHPDRFVSGEEMASGLGLSRTAVWKAIDRLRAEGYAIESVPRKGHRLAAGSDVLSEEGIRCYLTRNDLQVKVFPTITSTNTVLKQMASEEAPAGLALVAGEQTAGRGRLGRSFYSPAGSGLYLSLLLRPEMEAAEATKLTACAAVAAAEAIESLADIRPGIKWVNDVLLDNKKVCGILCEASYALEDQKLFAVVVGLGINVYPPKEGFPEEIKDIAGTVFDQSETGIRNQLAAEIINRFMAYYKHVTENGYQGEYIKRSIVPGKDIEVHAHGEVKQAHALAIDDTCGLMVRYEDGSAETLHFGEVSIKGLY